MSDLQRLRFAHPWPREMPDMDEDWHGWLATGTRRMLLEQLKNRPQVIVELGSWLGLSAKFFMENSDATLICVDHWNGSPSFQTRPAIAKRCPTAYQQFQRNLWPWRDRIIQVRMDAGDGLVYLSQFDIRPGLFYIDDDHTRKAVMSRIEVIARSWPTAVMVGDDYSRPDTAGAADTMAATLGRPIATNEAAFTIVPQ